MAVMAKNFQNVCQGRQSPADTLSTLESLSPTQIPRPARTNSTRALARPSQEAIGFKTAISAAPAIVATAAPVKSTAAAPAPAAKPVRNPQRMAVVTISTAMAPTGIAMP